MFISRGNSLSLPNPVLGLSFGAPSIVGIVRSSKDSSGSSNAPGMLLLDRTEWRDKERVRVLKAGPVLLSPRGAPAFLAVMGVFELMAAFWNGDRFGYTRAISLESTRTGLLPNLKFSGNYQSDPHD